MDETDFTFKTTAVPKETPRGTTYYGSGGDNGDVHNKFSQMELEQKLLDNRLNNLEDILVSMSASHRDSRSTDDVKWIAEEFETLSTDYDSLKSDKEALEIEFAKVKHQRDSVLRYYAILVKQLEADTGGLASSTSSSTGDSLTPDSTADMINYSVQDELLQELSLPGRYNPNLSSTDAFHDSFNSAVSSVQPTSTMSFLSDYSEERKLDLDWDDDFESTVIGSCPNLDMALASTELSSGEFSLEGSSRRSQSEPNIYDLLNYSSSQKDLDLQWVKFCIISIIEQKMESDKSQEFLNRLRGIIDNNLEPDGRADELLSVLKSGSPFPGKGLLDALNALLSKSFWWVYFLSQALRPCKAIRNSTSRALWVARTTVVLPYRLSMLGITLPWALTKSSVRAVSYPVRHPVDAISSVNSATSQAMQMCGRLTNKLTFGFSGYCFSKVLNHAGKAD